jgi:hypothetical protein
LAAFSISADAASAKLTATVPVQNSHGKIYNARVQVTWTASGPPTSFVDRYKQFGPDGVFIQITKGKGRSADAAGKISIPGSTYVVKTGDAGISKQSTITITRTSSPPQS